MGYGLIPYLVDATKLESAVGSKDSRLLRSIEAQWADEMERMNEDLDFEEPTLQEAMGHLINGSKMNSSAGAQYGYAFEILCELFGEHLVNDEWYPIGARFYDDINSLLEKVGAKVNLWLVLQTEPPFGIPTPDDFPAIGYLTPEEARKIHLELSTVTTGALQEAAGALEFDDRFLKPMHQLKTWFEQAVAQNKGLAFFYY